MIVEKIVISIRKQIQELLICFSKNNILFILKFVVLGFFIIIGTFPENDWTFSVGIDPSLVWVFNYFASNGLALGESIIFPHGPLAFFMYPLPENVPFVYFVMFLFKILLFVNFYFLTKKKNRNNSLIFAFILAYFISIFAPFNQLILSNVILLYANYFITKKSLYTYVAIVITAFAFYVKSYVGIISIVIFVSFQLYQLISTKSCKKILIDSIVLFGMILTSWLLIFHSFGGFFIYLYGLVNLAQDNSSAAAFYPENNWWVLTLFIIITLIIPFTNKDKKSAFLGFILGLSLFAAWKHGMAREDVYHVYGFLHYIIIVLVIFNAFVDKNRIKNLILSIAAICLLVVNNSNAINYYDYGYKIIRVNNFVEYVSDFSQLSESLNKVSDNNIKENELPDEILNEIGNSTVDIYPWDYSIIHVNNLNWQPRIVIQSYASYTSWLDKKNAQHFNSDKAPAYIVWHYTYEQESINGGVFNSIDRRNLFNDEPHTLMSIINNYSYFYSNNKFLILKKSNQVVNLSTTIISQGEYKWGEWISVPDVKDKIIRAKLDFTKSFLQRLKSFTYKDESFWVSMKSESGNIYKYRIVPKNSLDGIWINPNIMQIGRFENIVEIMFESSNPKIISKNVIVDFEGIDIFSKVKNVFQLEETNEFYNSKNGFEEQNVEYWSDAGNRIYTSDSYMGNNSVVLVSGEFSPSFVINTDSIPLGYVDVNCNCWAKVKEVSKDVVLVISLERNGETIFWEGRSFDKQVDKNNYWVNVKNSFGFDNNTPGAKLKIYVWNNSDETLLIDDFVVIFR